MYQSLSGFMLAALITCADFHIAKLVRRMRMANQSVENQCGARQLNGLSRSLRKRVEQFFTTPALSTAANGPSGLTISPRMSASGFGLICRSARLRSIKDGRYSAMDITVAVGSTS